MHIELKQYIIKQSYNNQLQKKIYQSQVENYTSMVNFIQFQSHFSFNPFFLCHPNLQTQIQPNLQPFYLMNQNLNYLRSLSVSFPENLNLFYVPDSNKFLNQNFSLNSFNQYLPTEQLTNFQNFSYPNIGQLLTIQNQFTSEKNDKTSSLKQQQVEFQEKDSEQRNFKKKRGKKLSKKEKKQKQIRRNTIENSKRNIVPNQIHQILSILFKRNKSGLMVEKLIKKFCTQSESLKFSANRFYLYQSLLKQKVNHYANESSLKYLLIPLDPQNSIYMREEQQLYIKVGLTLIQHFIRNEANITILNSQRIKASNRMEHMRTKRYLQQFLKQLILKKQQEQIFQSTEIKEEQIQE